MIIETQDLGITSYQDALKYQTFLFDSLIGQKKKNIPITVNYLLFTEHNPVITIGKKGKISNILEDSTELKKSRIELYNSNRGGDVTFHAPGQLVIYPILDLSHFKLGVKDYVALLENAVIETIKKYGITGFIKEEAPGVWTKNLNVENKICALGLKCSRWCTMHGIALNVNIDLTGFQKINPCGFVDKGVTSILNETGKFVEIQDVKKIFSDVFFSLIFSL